MTEAVTLGYPAYSEKYPTAYADAQPFIDCINSNPDMQIAWHIITAMPQKPPAPARRKRRAALQHTTLDSTGDSCKPVFNETKFLMRISTFTTFWQSALDLLAREEKKYSPGLKLASDMFGILLANQTLPLSSEQQRIRRAVITTQVAVLSAMEAQNHKLFAYFLDHILGNFIISAPLPSEDLNI